jgi:hypothetical protein
MLMGLARIALAVLIIGLIIWGFALLKHSPTLNKDEDTHD